MNGVQRNTEHHSLETNSNDINEKINCSDGADSDGKKTI